MADPVIPGGIRAQVILQGKSNLPEDRFVTTWAFKAPPDTVDPLHHGQVAAMLTDFYTGLSVSGQTITGNLGAQIIRGVGAGMIKTYDLGQLPKQRVPVETAFDVIGGDPSNSFPAEVAVTASFHGDAPGPRTRGRVYLGPWSTGAGEKRNDGSVGVLSAIRIMIAEAMARLEAFPRPEYPQWCILSQANGTLVPVTGGWVDDAFDTQRRRGIAATTRNTWAA